jgi:transcriptional regulator with XRE-family HTH domain
MTEMEKIGRNIAKIRSEKGLSQEDLAGLSEVARNYISRIENGKVSFSVPVLLRIAKALNIKPEKLFI